MWLTATEGHSGGLATSGGGGGSRAHSDTATRCWTPEMEPRIRPWGSQRRIKCGRSRYRLIMVATMFTTVVAARDEEDDPKLSIHFISNTINLGILTTSGKDMRWHKDEEEGSPQEREHGGWERARTPELKIRRFSSPS